MGNMILCGVCVDEKDYNNFALKEYDVPHDFKDGKRSLWNIEQMSKMSDYKKHYPQFAEECRKIVEREKRNIQSYYAKKDGRKEFVTMRHDNFQGYLEDLRKIHKAAADERASMKKKYDRAAEEWKEAQNDATLSDYGKTAAKMKYLEAEKQYKDFIADLQTRTKADIKDIREAFEEHVADFYSANGDRMDEGVVRLLNSGIKLTDGEIDRLVGQNVSNPTMLRLISDHCEKNKSDNKMARAYGTYARAAGSHERRLFDQVVEMVDRVTGYDDVIATTWGNEKGHFERLSNGIIENMTRLAVKPAEVTAE